MGITTVLLVDDEPHIRRIGEVSLRSVGRWTPILAASGAEAIEITQRAPPDLILLDVMMPDIDGPSTLARLKANPETARIPVIFMTAKVQTHEVQYYLSLGAAGVIRKPFDPMKLPEEIVRILEGAA